VHEDEDEDEDEDVHEDEYKYEVRESVQAPGRCADSDNGKGAVRHAGNALSTSPVRRPRL
jgi:hypothetical protein